MMVRGGRLVLASLAESLDVGIEKFWSIVVSMRSGTVFFFFLKKFFVFGVDKGATGQRVFVIFAFPPARARSLSLYLSLSLSLSISIIC